MGWCPECAAEGSNPEHKRTLAEGLCKKHYMRHYRATKKGKEAVSRYNRSDKAREQRKRWYKTEAGQAYMASVNAKRSPFYRRLQESKDKEKENEAT